MCIILGPLHVLCRLFLTVILLVEYYCFFKFTDEKIKA